MKYIDMQTLYTTISQQKPKKQTYLYKTKALHYISGISGGKGSILK